MALGRVEIYRAVNCRAKEGVELIVRQRAGFLEEVNGRVIVYCKAFVSPLVIELNAQKLRCYLGRVGTFSSTVGAKVLEAQLAGKKQLVELVCHRVAPRQVP